MTFRDRLIASWYAPRPSALAIALTPLAGLFAIAASIRRALYRTGVLRSVRIEVPVVVVGNCTAGGSGKTPLVAALARALSDRGFVPGIVSRGYGRRRSHPVIVRAGDSAADVGDEPLLLARAGWPVAVASDRAAAARMVIAAHPRCDVVLCDDGLQHYALARDVEIAVVDGRRRFGNGLLLPAGPLREPRSRLASVDAIVVLQAERTQRFDIDVPVFAMAFTPRPLRRVGAPDVERAIADFAGLRVHAVAGIGDPQRFFDSLSKLGIDVEPHPFADHHAYVASDLAFGDAAPVVMTEKDAVKCASFADERCWYLPIDATIEAALTDFVVEKLKWMRSSSKSSSAP